MNNKTWFITGSSRGLGLEISKAALDAGHNVIATSRNSALIAGKLGINTDRLLCLDVDVTEPKQVEEAVAAGATHFGRIDVLVNNAGYGQLGFFEENSLQEAQAQFGTNLFGVLNVTWAALPIMRSARSGHIFNISSTAGIRGSMAGAVYCASKFGIEGFSEALAAEVEPFGLNVTIVEPGLFRTDFLDASSVCFGEKEIPDYAEQSSALQKLYRGMSGQQKGNPRKLAEAMVRLADEKKPPLRFAAGSDAIATVEGKINSLRDDLDRWRDLSASVDGFD